MQKEDPHIPHAIVVLVTVPSREEGEKIARLLVEEKLAACVNIVAQGVTSIFRWEGAVSVAAEVLLIVKTERARFPLLVEAVKKHHTYSVPEIIALPIVDGERSYLAWIGESVSG
jgi:periplasmic divalent cation tolerance protein